MAGNACNLFNKQRFVGRYLAGSALIAMPLHPRYADKSASLIKALFLRVPPFPEFFHARQLPYWQYRSRWKITNLDIHCQIGNS